MIDVNSIAKNMRLIVNKGRETEDNIIIGRVVSVTGDRCVVQPIYDAQAELLDVRLTSETHSTNFLVTPAIDSIVLVLAFSDIETSDFLIVMFSEIDTISIRGTQYDGLVKVGDLITKMNNLENKVNDLCAKMNSHTHTGVTTGGGSSGPLSSPIVGTLTPTNQSEIENINVKHG